MKTSNIPEYMRVIQTDTCQYDADFFEENGLDVRNFFFASHIKDSFFFIKDMNARMVMGNIELLRSFKKYKILPLMLLKNSAFVEKTLCKSYVRDDLYVMKTGRSIVNKTELTPSEGGKCLVWRSTTKEPLYGKNGKIVGLISISQRLLNEQEIKDNFSSIDAHIEKNIGRNITVGELSKIYSLSVSAFARKFTKIYKISPLKYINSVRTKHAAAMLLGTDKSISEIACESGFCDQSHMNKTFKSILELTPKQYRKSALK